MFTRAIPILLLASFATGLRILGVFPHPGKSHFDVFQPLLRALAERGHQLTVISYLPQRIDNYRNIDLSENANVFVEVVAFETVQGRILPEFHEPYLLATFARDACEKGFGLESVQQLVKATNVSFDLMITEFFNSECFTPFAHKFDVPIVGLSSCVILPWYNERFGNPDNPAYIPVGFLGHNGRASFVQRVQNTVMLLWSNLIYNWLIYKPASVMAKQQFGEDIPEIEAIFRNYTRLLLVNSHFSLNLPRPLVPSVVEVGGLNLLPHKDLPKNIEKWINESTHGVIYFSLGSMIKGHTFPEEKRRIFLRAFGRLPQRVLWKWENETMPGKPDNVMIQKWMPQFDILCHPNVKAFIAHGGLLGTTEAVHCGVPAVVMPQYGDQHTNARAWEANGAAVVLQLKDVTDENLAEALNTVLDPKFKKQAEELSFRFRDRPMSPLDTAIYWVEYVARHKGARHLQTAAVGMPYYKYLLLDVIAFLAIVLALIAYVNYIVWRKILGMIFGRKGKVKTS